MEKMLLIGVDSTTRNAVDACRRRGVYTIITDFMTPEANPMKLYSDEYWVLDCSSIDELEEKSLKEGITSIYAGCNEFCLDHAGILARRLGLPFYASDFSWKVSRDKLLMKKVFEENGFSFAKTYHMEKAIDPQILKTIEYPLVVKPADSSAMRGFSIVQNEEEFYKAYDLARSFSDTQKVIVEDYLSGMEFAINGIAHNGEIRVYACTNIHKYEVDGKPVMVAAMPFDPELDECCTPAFLHDIVELTKIFQVHNGVFFYQGIRHKGKPCLTEFAARLDGTGVWNVHNMLTGQDTLSVMVDLQRGKEPEFDVLKMDYHLKGRCSALYGIWIRPGIVKEILGEDEILADSRIDILFSRFKPGMEVKPTGNMTQMGWFINFIADSKEELFTIYEKINHNLKIISTKGENLCIYYHNYTEIQL